MSSVRSMQRIFGKMDEKEGRRLEAIAFSFPHLAKVQKHNSPGYTLKLYVLDEKEMKAIAAFVRQYHGRKILRVVPQRKSA
jgi:hypothetical protein